MVHDRWQYNNEAKFNVIARNQDSYLVCHTNQGFSEIHFVENLKTGVRKFPTSEHEGLPSHEVINQLLRSF